MVVRKGPGLSCPDVGPDAREGVWNDKQLLYPGELNESAKKVEKMKWLPIILNGTFLLGLTVTWGADWKYYAQTQTASYFFDGESIIDQENIVRVW